MAMSRAAPREPPTAPPMTALFLPLRVGAGGGGTMVLLPVALARM